MSDEDIHYARIFAKDACDELLKECSKLFGEHYGCWSSTLVDQKLSGKPIKLSYRQLRDYLPGDDSWIATARKDGILIGYALAVRFPHKKTDAISWVTQLVVHKDYQNQLIGSTILNSIWGFSNHFAWGIASANPYAIRALEKATRRRCDPTFLMKSTVALCKLMDRIPYLRGKAVSVNTVRSVVDTGFYQDLSHVGEKIKHVSSKHPWRLGKIQDGEEWLAATFHRQKPIKWTAKESEQFMAMSGKIAREAYERMSEGMDQSEHSWASPRGAEAEVDFLVEKMSMPLGSSVLDFGCGSGRHSIALAARGYDVVGVDFSQRSIKKAREKTNEAPQRPAISPNFYFGDCRHISLERQFDFGFCLYDVIGSFPDDSANMKILDNFMAHIRPGGRIALSVMSFDYIEQKATFRHERGDIQDRLANLKASSTMQESGEIFNPEYILLDVTSRIVYRKEMFDTGSTLPTELIVRDRRYGLDEIRDLCRKAGLAVETCGYIKAGDFALATQTATTPGKEILVIGQKSLM